MTTTSLPRSPPPSYYLDGMVLGAGVDAITGEVTKSALASDFKTANVTSSDSGETFAFKIEQDATSLESLVSLGFSSSVTFPVSGVDVKAKGTMDFSSSNKSSTFVLFIVLDWERYGSAIRIVDPKLDAKAQTTATTDTRAFRAQYGDYFVYQVSNKMKFSAVWKCTSEKHESMTSFKKEISASIPAKVADVSASFSSTLSSAASKTSVSVEVQYQAFGDAGSTQYDPNDVVSTFDSFRKSAKPVPYQVLLHHYNTVDTKVPLSIALDPDVYNRLCEVFALARFILFLNGVVPGTRSVRVQRRDRIARLYTQIHSKRSQLEHNPDSGTLKTVLKDMTGVYDLLFLLLQRQDLVMEMHGLTYADMKSKFAVDHENVRGAWVKAADHVEKYTLGRTGFSPAEVTKYAVVTTQVAQVQVGSGLSQQVGALEFPGNTGINGYVVGLTVEDRWKDGTTGYWCVGKGLLLGTKQAKVEVKTDPPRGMHWGLQASYIPCSQYDECSV